MCIRDRMKTATPEVRAIRGKIDKETYAMSPTYARNVGRVMVKAVVKSIQDWSDPPNAERTIKRKGFNDPLVETKRMQRAVKYKLGSIGKGRK